MVEEEGVKRIALIAPTAADVRDVMVEGESGILARCPPWNMPTYLSSKRKVQWPNGAVAMMYSAEEANRLRGPQHEKAWCDELTSWKDPGTWDMMMLGLRIGKQPQAFVTTTAQIGHRLLKNIIKDPYTVRTKGHTFENEANLSAQFIEHIRKIYEGTRLGKQELEGEYLDEGTGVLWNEECIQHTSASLHDINRVVVSIDPSITTSAEGAETGLVVCGRDNDLNGYVMADHSGHYSPNGWAQRAIDLYKTYKANYIVAETNNGGDMVIATIQNIDPNIPCKKVVATRGKRTRAEPISMLYEQKRVWHIGHHHKLEEQMIDFNPDDLKIANDRVDAMVWGLTELIINHSEVRIRSL
jgi:phage terminase large subunit-like protein